MHTDILNTSIEFLKGVGPKRAEHLKSELSIYTYRDLLNHFPFRYVDRSKLNKINQISKDLKDVQLLIKIKTIQELGHGRKKRLVALAEDESGSIQLIWFK